MDAFEIELGQVTRGRIVRFAGAIGDFNPIHYDDEFARKAGMPSAIAHGPLVFALALDGLVRKFGGANIEAFKVRLKAPVVAGDTLALRCDEHGAVAVSSASAEVLSGVVEIKK